MTARRRCREGLGRHHQRVVGRLLRADRAPAGGRRAHGHAHGAPLRRRRPGPAALRPRRRAHHAARGGSVGTRAVGLVNRTAQLLGSASSGRFDVAAGSHASDFVLTAWTLAIAQMTFVDPDRLGRSNLVNVRLVDEVAVPEAVPVAGLTSIGATRDKLFRYPGFKEEYYLHDAQPDPDALARLGVEHRRVAGVVRPAAPAVRAAGRRSRAGGRGRARPPARRPGRTAEPHPRGRGQRRGPAPPPPRARAARRAGARRPVDGVGLMAAADFVVGARRRDAARGRRAGHARVHALALRRARRGLAARGRPAQAHHGAERHRAAQEGHAHRPALPRDPWLFADRLLELARHRCRRRASAAWSGRRPTRCHRRLTPRRPTERGPRPRAPAGVR